MKINKTILTLSILVSIISCKKDSDSTDTLKSDYNRKAMLTNYANNIISPSYDSLKKSIDDLELNFINFENTKNITNLKKIRTSFINSYTKWQGCSFFDFGPSKTYAIKSSINIFPTDSSKINNNITTGGYNLATAGNINATGLPALDFLLFKDSSASITLNYLNTDTKRVTYIKDIITQIKTNINLVNNQWGNGSYTTTFISLDGTATGSSLSKIINSLNLDLEKYIRDGKVGIPLGIRSLGNPLPEKTEAYFSKKSLTLLNESINKFQNYFNGNGENSGTSGLDDYLNHLDSRVDGILLSTKINTQFNNIKTKIAALNNTISEEVIKNKSKVQELYTEIQKLLILTKVNMPSALSTLITYKDNDGD